MGKRCFLLAAAVLILTASGAFAQWNTVYQTDFEAPTYTVGQTINGQDGWALTSSTLNEQITVQKEPDPSTNQFMYIGLSSVGTGSTVGAYHQIPTTGTGSHVRLSYDWMMLTTDVNSNNEAYGLWAMLTGTTDPAANRAGMIGGNYDTTSGTGTFKAFGGGGAGWTAFGSFSLNTAYELMMDVDMTNKIYDVYLNGEKKLSGLGFYTATLESVSYVHFYRRYKAGTYAIDNVSVETVPEPSSILALACGLAGLAGYIRRKV